MPQVPVSGMLRLGEKSKVTIPAGSLDVGANYTLSLTGSIKGGLNSLSLAVTNIPFGGSCGITPTVGKSLDVFTVNCVGWKDGTGVVDQKPSFDYDYVIGDRINPVFSTTPMLPSGEAKTNYTYMFRVHIRNIFGAKSIVEFNVTVFPSGDMTELVDMVSSFSTLDPTQVVLALDDTLTSFQSFTQIVTQDDVMASEGDKASQVLANMLSTMNEVGKELSSYSDSVTSVLKSSTAMVKNIPKTVSTEVKEGALSSISCIGNKLVDMSKERKTDIATLLLQGLKPTMDIIDLSLPEAVEEEGEVNLDAIPDEVEEERKKQAKAKKNKDADKLKKLTATATKDLISSINNAMLDDIEINRSKTLGDSSLPVSLTMKGVAPGSSAVVVTDDGTVQLPDMKTSSSAIAQVAVMKKNIYSWAASSRDVDSSIFVVEMHDKNGDPLTSTEKLSGKVIEK
ncbi:hypothetical protein LSAT2_021010 [Lamellibrachia satsuma]|nr:hypothetical protein LSAT2_021010 [Lamellibrachia satsuma]